MKRRAVLVLAVLALVAGGCGGGGKKVASIDYPKGPEDVIVRIENKGGFVIPTARLTEVPAVSVFGDGRYVTLGPQIEIFPQPALPNLVSRRITQAGIQAILAAAQEAGLMAGNRRLDNQMVADASTAVFTVQAGGKLHVIEAVALGDGFPGGQDPALRKSLVEFRDLLTDLGRWLPKGSVSEEKPYEYSTMRVLAEPYVPSDEGGVQQPKPWPGSDFGRFGSARNEAPQLRCGVVRGDDLARLNRLATGANQLTPWVSGDKSYRLQLRPLLPDESGC